MKLFVFGLGYSATHLVLARRDMFSSVAGTQRTAHRRDELARAGVDALPFDGGAARAAAEADAIVVSIPPGDDGADPVLAAFGETLAAARARAVLYLSTVGVYGDAGGAWVDEATPPRPTSPRNVARVAVEARWRDLFGERLHSLRLSGIYGPGRSAIRALRTGAARRTSKPGQVFNRIHVDDIAGFAGHLLAAPRPGADWNVTDDEPAPQADVVAFAAGLAGVEPPPERPFDEAELSPMAREFWAENKRVGNARMRAVGYAPRHPTYREGLRAIFAETGGAG
ncbi:MAG: SDR family oxidoreductase [Hyphomicrobiales bacterium]|nr:SDR family oxidoreductase [Hyphomicrobiales bacterium]